MNGCKSFILQVVSIPILFFVLVLIQFTVINGSIDMQDYNYITALLVFFLINSLILFFIRLKKYIQLFTRIVVVVVAIVEITFVYMLLNEANIQISFDLIFFIRLMVSAIFLVVSSGLPKVERNLYFGVRLRKALDSEYIWKKTNMFTAKAIQFFSVIGILISPLISEATQFLELLWGLCLFLPIILGVIYCYFIKEN